MEKVVQGKFQSHGGKGQGDEEKGLVKIVEITIAIRSIETIREAAIVGRYESNSTMESEQTKMFIHMVSMGVRFQEVFVPPECFFIPLSNLTFNTSSRLIIQKRNRTRCLNVGNLTVIEYMCGGDTRDAG